MDSFIAILILFLLIGLLEKVLKGASAKQQRRAPPPDQELSGDELQPTGRGPVSLHEIIAEELGISLERRPRVRELPEPTAEARDAHPAARGREGAPSEVSARDVVYPRPRPSGAERGAGVADRRRRAATQRERPREPERYVSLEERAILERGEPVSSERPRRPEDHWAFHERYRVAEPVRSLREFDERYVDSAARPRRRSAVRLPARDSWSAAEKAIVWAEVLGPPKGLLD